MHEMKIQPAYYEAILNGNKRIEIRLNDDKRQLIKIGDVINFKRADNLEENFDVIVIDLLYYPTFDEIINDLDIELIANNDSDKNDLKALLSKFYTKEDEQKYGVVGINFELRDISGKI
jgi:ASC-1-like (ASCH) protein